MTAPGGASGSPVRHLPRIVVGVGRTRARGERYAGWIPAASTFQSDAADNASVANPSEDWRARALASFPDLREGLEEEGDIFSVYILLGELLHLLKGTYRKSDDDMLGASTATPPGRANRPTTTAGTRQAFRSL